MIIIYILAIFSLSFLVKESDGPWGIMSKLRNKLLQNKYIGVFFYQLLNCYHCVGTWAGVSIYFLSQKDYSLNLAIIWGLAGGTISLFLDALLVKLNESKN
jgi:hypothetical protein